MATKTKGRRAHNLKVYDNDDWDSPEQKRKEKELIDAHQAEQDRRAAAKANSPRARAIFAASYRAQTEGGEFEDYLPAWMTEERREIHYQYNRGETSSEDTHPEVKRTFTYRDKHGKPHTFIKKMSDGTFRTFHECPNGAGEQPRAHPVGSILYDLPELLKKSRKNESVLITEGEKDAETVKLLGYLATTNPNGAMYWDPALNEVLQGRDLVILEDNDDAGFKRSGILGQQLLEKANSIRRFRFKDVPRPLINKRDGRPRVEYENTPSHYDVTDWFMEKKAQLCAQKIHDTMQTAQADILEKTPSISPERLEEAVRNKTAVPVARIKRFSVELPWEPNEDDKEIATIRAQIHDEIKAEFSGMIQSLRPCVRLRDLGHREKIVYSAGSEANITDKVAGKIAMEADVYRHSDSQIIVREDFGKIIEVTEAWLEYHLAESFAFFKYGRPSGRPKAGEEPEFKECPVGVPGWLARRVLQALPEQRGLKRLNGIVTSPTMTLKGKVLDEARYYEDEGLILRGLNFEKVPEKPKEKQLLEAVKTLWEPFRLFRFETSHDVAGMMAALLMAPVRRSLPTAPGICFDAPTSGSGKTLLGRCILHLAGGDAQSVFSQLKDNDEESRKRLFAHLLSGSGGLMIDNIRGRMKSPFMEYLLTTEYMSDRKLSKSETQSVSARVMVIMSGNNFIPSGDIPRRLIMVRVDTGLERPHSKAYPFNPERMVQQKRQKLIQSILIILRAYMVSKNFDLSVTKGIELKTGDGAGSFDEFNGLIRGCVHWLGEKGVKLQYGKEPAFTLKLGDPMAKAMEAADHDEDKIDHRIMMQSLQALFGEETWTTTKVVEEIRKDGSFNAEHDEAIKEIKRIVSSNMPRGSSEGSWLGNYIRYRKDRPQSGLVFRQAASNSKGVNMWKVARYEGG